MYDDFQQMRSFMEKHGAGLVSNFRCSDSFSTSTAKRVANGRAGYLRYDGTSENPRIDFVELDLHSKDDKTTRGGLFGRKGSAAGISPRVLDAEFSATNKVSVDSGRRWKVSRRPRIARPRRDNNPDFVNIESRRRALDKKESYVNGMPEYHAMVLIGMRRDNKTGKAYYLLQNWWPDMPIVEVSAEYIQSCDASVLFVYNKDILGSNDSLDGVFVSNSSRVTECRNIDRPDGHSPSAFGPRER